VVGDHVLQRHQQRGLRRGLLERDEARQDLRRDLHAREHRLVGDRVAHEHGEAQRQVGDVRERAPGRDRQRRQRGEDRLLEVPGQLRAALLVEVVHVDHANVVLGQRRAQPAFEAVGQPAALLEHALADQRDRLGGAEPVLARVLHAGVDLVAQAGHPHHVELVEVGRVDGAELHALQQRHALILSQLQHAIVEVEPRELAVQI
jgi:hypothetical protein